MSNNWRITVSNTVETASEFYYTSCKLYPVKVKTMKEQQRIINNQGKVTIQEVQLEDEGEYECNINHLREGREESTSHEVVVRIKVRLE